MAKGKVFLIPMFLSDSNDKKDISEKTHRRIISTRYFLAENIRTARRYISSLGLGIDIESLEFEDMGKHNPSDITRIFDRVASGTDLGVISEAGLPAIADPGKNAVAYAHRHGFEVVPLAGGSSIILGLISSGFNGQNFTFHGYLPIEERQRKVALNQMEQSVLKTGYTQLFMETPYRNEQLFKLLINSLRPDTELFIGADITGENEYVKTKTIKEWQAGSANIKKIPCVFAIGKTT